MTSYETLDLTIVKEILRDGVGLRNAGLEWDYEQASGL